MQLPVSCKLKVALPYSVDTQYVSAISLRSCSPVMMGTSLFSASSRTGTMIHVSVVLPIGIILRCSPVERNIDSTGWSTRQQVRAIMKFCSIATTNPAHHVCRLAIDAFGMVRICENWSGMSITTMSSWSISAKRGSFLAAALSYPRISSAFSVTAARRNISTSALSRSLIVSVIFSPCCRSAKPYTAPRKKASRSVMSRRFGGLGSYMMGRV